VIKIVEFVLYKFDLTVKKEEEEATYQLQDEDLVKEL